MADPRRTGPAALAAVLVVFTVVAAIPWTTERRDYPASIPQATPLFFTSVVRLAPGAEACFNHAVIEPRSEEARFRVGTIRRAGAPLLLRMDGPGYRSRSRIPGGYADNTLLEVPVTPPARATPVRVCIRNGGRTRMDLYGAADRTRSRSRTRVDGRLVRPNVAFGFWERRERTLADRLPETVERMTVMRAALIGEWLVWPLLLLGLVGVPIGLVWGFRTAIRAEPGD